MDIIQKLKHTRSSLPPCSPPKWARTGHLQTILGHLLPSPLFKAPGVDLEVVLEDKDRLHVTYFEGISKTIVYFFHGLAGSAEASYMHRSAGIAHSLGHHVFMVNHRGCGKGRGLASGPYHSGRGDDLSAVLDFGKKMLSEHTHVAVGFSLSANALLLLCAGQRGSVLPDVAIAVNAPINLDVASVNLTKGLNRIYNLKFMLELRRHIKKNTPDKLHLIQNVWELRRLDEAFTAPAGGFKDRAHYYSSCSAHQFLKDIKVPTVIITAKDDPFVCSKDYQMAALSENAILHLEEHGGHMGYLTQSGASFERWLDLALTSYLRTAGEQ
jgi:predicted alpha/beta-fold hydrolase